jgi:hypothetical protein
MYVDTVHEFPAHLSNVELLWELVEDGAIGALVLLNDGGDEGDELVPELQVVQPWAGVLGVPFGLVGVNLNTSNS